MKIPFLSVRPSTKIFPTPSTKCEDLQKSYGKNIICSYVMDMSSLDELVEYRDVIAVVTQTQ